MMVFDAFALCIVGSVGKKTRDLFTSHCNLA